jgi:STE24 endopeptidase
VRRPVLVAAGAGTALSLALNTASLPLTAVAHARAVDVGLSTQSWGAWGGDVAKAWGIGAAGAGAGAGAAIALMRRFPRGWWLPASGVVVAFGVAMTYAGPVVLDPVFNRFTKLPAGRTRSDVLTVARQAGVKVRQVYEVDASRRTTAANAYVTGLGATKRVVLYDTLLRSFSRDELRLVVAHELGHVHYRDVPHGLLYLLLVTPGAMWAAAQLTRRLAPAEGQPGPSSLPALGLAIGVVALGVGTISNQLSRRVEARADSFSLRVTGEPEPFIAFERGIALRNVADPDPPRWLTLLLATHPPTIDRIGIALAYERGAR